MTQKTEQEAYLTLAALCAQAEHCQWDMTQRMQRWQLDAGAQARVMQRLVEERYVNDERYARAFVKDKVRYNHWGRRKVEQALWQKHIADDIRQQVLDEVDDDVYIDVLRPLLEQKRRSTRAANDYEMNQKLTRFALGRGFTFDVIRQCLDVDETDEFDV
jgi:regulatory protein